MEAIVMVLLYSLVSLGKIGAVWMNRLPSGTKIMNKIRVLTTPLYVKSLEFLGFFSCV